MSVRPLNPRQGQTLMDRSLVGTHERIKTRTATMALFHTVVVSVTSTIQNEERKSQTAGTVLMARTVGQGVPTAAMAVMTSPSNQVLAREPGACGQTNADSRSQRPSVTLARRGPDHISAPAGRVEYPRLPEPGVVFVMIAILSRQRRTMPSNTSRPSSINGHVIDESGTF